MFSAGPCMTVDIFADEMRKCEIPNALLASWHPNAPCKAELSAERSSGRIRGVLLILHETVLCVHLLTSRQRDDATSSILTKYFVLNTTGEKLTSLYYVSQSRKF